MYTSSFLLRTSAAKYQYGDFLFVGAMLALLPDLISGRRKLWLPWWMLLSAIMLLLGLAARLMLDLKPTSGDDVLVTIQVLFTMHLMIAVVANQQVNSSQDLKYLIYAWLLGVLTTALVGFLQSRGYSFSFLPGRMGTVISGRVPGLSGFSTLLGHSVALSVPLLTILLFSSRNTHKFLIWSGALALTLVTADLTGARMSLTVSAAGFVMAIGVTLMMGVRVAHIARAAFLVAFVLMVVVPYVGNSEHSAFMRIFQFEATTAIDSSMIRQQLQAEAWANFTLFPFAGFGYHDVAHAHNIWLGALEYGGVMGFFSLMIFQVAAMVYAWRAWLLAMSRYADRQARIIASALVVVFVVWLAYGINSCLMTVRSAYAILGVLFLMVLHLTQGAFPDRLGTAVVDR